MSGDARRRYLYMNTLENTGLSYPVMILTHSSGNNLGNSHFIWRVLDTDTVEQCFQKSLIVIDKVKLGIPQYHTRAMRQAMAEKFGRISPGVKPAVLRYFYKELTGDCSASNTTQESQVDERVRQLIDMEPEDPNTIVDLREAKKTDTKTKFDVFGNRLISLSMKKLEQQSMTDVMIQ